MASIISPKVNVIGYGPFSDLGGGRFITPDEWVWGGAAVTYKDIGVIEELRQMKEEEQDAVLHN